MESFLIENDSYWAKRADGYCQVNIKELNSEKKNEWLKFIINNIRYINNRKIKVLDIGTGPGFFAIMIASLGLEVTAIDYTNEMLEKAKENSGKYKDSIRFLKMDAHQLNFEDNTFDLIVTRNLTWNLCDPIKAYKEWYRVLAKGGKLINFDANWYNHLYDNEKRKEYENDRKNVSLRNIKDHYTCTNIDAMEEIAKKLPLSKIKRPAWDVEQLINIGAKHVKVEENIGDLLWDYEEKINYASTPMFVISLEK